MASKPTSFLLYPLWKENDPESNNSSIQHSYILSEFELRVFEIVIQDIHKVSFCAQNERDITQIPRIKNQELLNFKAVQTSELQTDTLVLKPKFSLPFISILWTMPLFTWLRTSSSNFGDNCAVIICFKISCDHVIRAFIVWWCRKAPKAMHLFQTSDVIKRLWRRPNSHYDMICLQFSRLTSAKYQRSSKEMKSTV